MSTLARFWSRVDQSGAAGGNAAEDAGCWIWLGAHSANGYGLFTLEGRRLYAHRIAYADAHGPIPQGLVVDHKCHTKTCVRPGHLQAVTISANAQNRDGAQANSKSGVRGVYFHQGKWRAQIRAGGRNHSGGVFDSIGEATAAASRLRASLMTNSLADR